MIAEDKVWLIVKTIREERIPHPAYSELLHKVANDPMEAGLMLPFESTVTASSGTIGSSASLAESSIIVSRATQNLLRSYLLQQPTAILTSKNYPSYSCFGHAGTYSLQFRRTLCECAA
jgi:hypothetical protein